MRGIRACTGSRPGLLRLRRTIFGSGRSSTRMMPSVGLAVYWPGPVIAAFSRKAPAPPGYLSAWTLTNRQFIPVGVLQSPEILAAPASPAICIVAKMMVYYLRARWPEGRGHRRCCSLILLAAVNRLLMSKVL